MSVVLNDDIATLNFTNCDNLKNTSLYVNNELFLGKNDFYEAMMNLVQYTPNVKNAVAGSVFDDDIDMSGSEIGLNISADKGNDSITGGLGENRIIFNGEHFVNDSINLTKGEKVIIDLTGYEDVSSENVSYTFNGKNLVIKTARGNITLNNFGTKRFWLG